MSTTHHIGDRLSYDGAVCTVRYVGAVKGTSGTWLGIEWDDPRRGKHDGSHKGMQYFKCKRLSVFAFYSTLTSVTGLSSSPLAASFVRPTRPAEPPQSFLEAVRNKYESEARGDFVPAKEIVISGKVAEEVGFDKIRRQQARLRELKIAILDGQRVKTAIPSGEDPALISKVCPSITDLDLSRNLITDFAVVREIVKQLPRIRSLKLRYVQQLP